MKKIFLTLTLVLFVIPFGMSQDLPSYVPTDGLVAYYPFNGNANDESGNGNHGTVNGATLTIDRDGNENSSYSFDGANDYIETSSSLVPSSGNFSLNLWVRCDSNSGNHSEALAQGGSEINSTYIGYTPGGNIRVGGGSDWEWDNIQSFPFGDWHMFSVIKMSEQSKLYIDGNLYDSSVDYTNPIDSGSTFFGRQQNIHYEEWWNGFIDDIGIWNRALTEQEIQNLYTSSTGDILLNGVVSAENNQIKNVADPTHNQDVTTKNYVDELIENQQTNNGKVYVFRVDYDGEALSGSQGSITQITDYGFSSGTVNFNHSAVSSVSFDFVDESQPPTSVIIYGYTYGAEGSDRYYNVGVQPMGLGSKVKVSTNTNTLVGGDVQTDLLSNYNGATTILNLTAQDIGAKSGVTSALVNVNAHAYIFFRF